MQGASITWDRGPFSTTLLRKIIPVLARCFATAFGKSTAKNDCGLSALDVQVLIMTGRPSQAPVRSIPARRGETAHVLTRSLEGLFADMRVGSPKD